MKRLKPLVIATLIIITIFMVGKYILDSLFGGMCGNEVIQEIPSPDGEEVAYIFSRDCGATTSVSYQLSILDKGDEFQNKSGNTFVSDGEFTIEWKSEKNLHVKYRKTSETYEMDIRVNGIKVEYVSE